MKKLFILSFFTILSSAITAFASDSWNYSVTATKLDHSRNNLSPNTGGSSFSFNQKNIKQLPQGQMTSLSQMLLRAPGVAQNSYGQIHVRGDHSNLQYRINGVILPETIAGFGQTLDTHFANKVDFLTGAMPAQYGIHTGGVVDIKTKTGDFAKGGRSEVMTGGNDTLGVNQQISGSKDNFNYYLSASYLQNNRGIESPTAARNPVHDKTKQDKIFGYFSYLIDASQRLSLMVSNADNHFQIPNSPNQPINYTLEGFNDFNSLNLNEKQKESNKYAVAALQGVNDYGIDYQVSTFVGYSDLKFTPDYAGDLIFNGVASNTNRSSLANGVQGDFSYQLNDTNIFRSGFFASNNSTKNVTNNAVFETDNYGNQISSIPYNIN